MTQYEVYTKITGGGSALEHRVTEAIQEHDREGWYPISAPAVWTEEGISHGLKFMIIFAKD